ncbi:MarR family transcriptional regulator [Paraburkholderia dipogonis]|uniref:MarR family transcriptional regulator n=1 Tax=Paraburkholderia dipogonis TaxID=1211383 RepID=A0A4Y8MK18_9BURK|nr:MarR family transcriptional regulator [Paraburkholderia dipogonis]TFE37816.1 MarR family transcriptional regulator [Paraburkholderia dipogonis]
MTAKLKLSNPKTRELTQLLPVANQPLDMARIRRKGNAALKARATEDKHEYFIGVAEARYVLRKVFRIVEDQAKKFGLDPLAHQALIQIYGSPSMELQVNQIASRLDITAAFSSSLVTLLVEKDLVIRRRGDQDQRVTYVAMTPHGREVMDAIDENVKFHVDYFVSQLSAEERESALSILMFYVGAKL